ncbi:MAG TPA: Calx-beta domain-containing protein [Gemmata sp.]|nr:Calx-beta domain-containing protein [Gemmata sp.]
MDYQAASGTLTFAPGETSKTITVLVDGDRLGEYDESFYINLTSENAHIDCSNSTGAILDDEPRISISSASIVEGNRGSQKLTFTVTLSLPYDQTVTVKYYTQDITARAGEDYVATSGTLTFAPGETSKTFTVVIKGDKNNEPHKSCYIWLTDASSNARLWQNYGWGDILNDDGGRTGRKGKSN